MDGEGRTYLEGKKLDQEHLKERLKDLVESKGLVNLILQADENVKHGSVVRVMDLAKVSGVRSIIIAARWDPGKGF
jgi:biopolymer transport protein ExbD